MLDTLWQDVRYALRGLWRSPGFALAAIVTLALGIGANTAVFSLLNAVVLRTLPVKDPGQLSLFYQVLPPRVGDAGDNANRSDIFSYQAFARVEQAAPADVTMAAMSDSIARMALRVGPGSQPIAAGMQLVSGRFFDAVGVTPAAGRLFGPDDNNNVDAEPVAVLRYGFAQQQFGNVDAAIGQTIPINDTVFTIVGVAQNGFQGVIIGDAVDVYVPAVMQHVVGYRQNYSTNNADGLQPWIPQGGIDWLALVGRGRSDAIDRARPLLEAAFRSEVALEVARRGDSNDVETQRFRQVALSRESFAGGRSNVRRQFSSALLILMGMVGVVLLIACANIANLLLARAAGRRHEIAVRLSLGAGRLRLVRQMLVESLCLAAVGAAVAVPLGRWLSTALAQLAAVRNLLPQQFTIESTVLVFGIGLTTATAVLVGVVPAWRATSHPPASDLRSTGAGRVITGTRPMNVLVAVQVALSVVLVAAAALLGRTFVNLQQFDPGFEKQQLVSVRLNTPDLSAFRPADLAPLRAEILRRALRVPGVVSAEVSATGTLTGAQSIGNASVEGYVAAPGEEVRAQANRVGAGYFTTVGMQLREGRFIDERDVADGRLVAVVNEAFVRRYGRGRSGVGLRIGLGNEINTDVVGVVADSRINGLREAPTPMAFYPLTQRIGFPRYLDVRVTGDAAAIGAQVRRALADVDPRLSVGGATTIETALNRGMSRDRLMAFVSVAFGGVALLLACVGIYGVLAYGVARRTREMGVRAALGATPSELVALVMHAGLRVVLPGLAIGLGATLLGARYLQTLLFGVDAYDLSTLAAVTVALLVSVVIACHLPARRAASIDPTVALRND